jgi:hypothetical protein
MFGSCLAYSRNAASLRSSQRVRSDTAEEVAAAASLSSVRPRTLLPLLPQ